MGTGHTRPLGRLARPGCRTPGVCLVATTYVLMSMSYDFTVAGLSFRNRNPNRRSMGRLAIRLHRCKCFYATSMLC